jgi:hypothetical protein
MSERALASLPYCMSCSGGGALQERHSQGCCRGGSVPDFGFGPCQSDDADQTSAWSCFLRLESDPACAREVLMPFMRAHHASACAITSDCARSGRATVTRAVAVQQIPGTSATEPPERHLRQRRHRTWCFDAGRLGRSRHRDADAAGQRDRK